MSTDAKVTKELIETLEDGKDGFAKGAEKLEDTASPELAQTFRKYSGQRADFAGELRTMAKQYGDDIHESGSVTAAVHRGWLTLKDALAGSSAKGVLDAAEKGEDHAVNEYEKALKRDLSPALRTVVERQFMDVKAAHDSVRSLQAAHS